jgi:hypothetical protein
MTLLLVTAAAAAARAGLMMCFRLAMMGFTGMILTELVSGMNTLQALGLQRLH